MKPRIAAWSTVLGIMFVLWLLTYAVKAAFSSPAVQILDTPARRPLIEELVVRAALDAGVPPSLAIGLAWEESRFRNVMRHEHNGSWSYGVMQLNDGTFPYARMLSTEENIESGVAYLDLAVSVCSGKTVLVGFSAPQRLRMLPATQRCAIRWYRGRR